MSQTGTIILGANIFPDGAPPSGVAGGDLSGTYPNPGVAIVGSSTAADVSTATQQVQDATDMPAADTLCLRDVNGNTQFAGVILNAPGSQPVAGSDYRGMLFVVKGDDGVEDKLQVCLKAADNSYSWVDIVSG